MFAGREDEIERIDQVLSETADLNPTYLLIVGERGIGKTSLLKLARVLATDISSTNGDNLDFLTVSICIDKRCGIAEFARKINLELEQELEGSDGAIKFIQNAWDFLQRLEVSGTKLREPSTLAETDSSIFDDLCISLSRTVKAMSSDTAPSNIGIRKQKDGLLILIDEADSAPPELDLGTIIKHLSEYLDSKKCANTIFILAGSPELRQVLQSSHESALRVFEEMELTPLKDDEVSDVIVRGLEKANEKNSTEVTITPDALKTIVKHSEGYPHFAQQFGYSSYRKDIDYEITPEDVDFKTALDCIGDRYYKNLYFDKIKEDKYRDVLRVIASFQVSPSFGSDGDRWVNKSQIKDFFRGKEQTLDNALRALTTRKILLKKPGSRGRYRLQWNGFAYWIKFFADTIDTR